MMKILVLLTYCILVFTFVAISQSKNMLNVQNLVNEDSSISNLLQGSFKDFSGSQIEVLGTEHPLSFYSVNKIVKFPLNDYRFLSKPLLGLFGYQNVTKDAYALYAILDNSTDLIDSLRILTKKFDSIVEDSEDCLYMWVTEGVEVVIKRNNFSKKRNEVIVFILRNMNYEDAISKEKVF